MAREDRKNIRAERKEEKAQAKTSKRNVKTERKAERKAAPPSASRKEMMGRTQAKTDQARNRERAAARAFLPKDGADAQGFKDFEGGGGWAYRKYADGKILVTDAPGTNAGAIGMELAPGDRFYEQIDAEIGGRPIPQMAAPAAEPATSEPLDLGETVITATPPKRKLYMDEMVITGKPPEPDLGDVVRRVTSQKAPSDSSRPAGSRLSFLD